MRNFFGGLAIEGKWCMPSSSNSDDEFSSNAFNDDEQSSLNETTVQLKYPKTLVNEHDIK